MLGVKAGFLVPGDCLVSVFIMSAVNQWGLPGVPESLVHGGGQFFMESWLHLQTNLLLFSSCIGDSEKLRYLDIAV
jgi:hypothetical protein